MDLLQQRGLQTEKLHIIPALRSADGIGALLSAADRADIILLASPLYVDSLPSQVLQAFELIAEQRRNNNNPRRQRLLAVINCGFPEARHNDTALAQCRIFCREAGIGWAGGLGLGGGGMVGGLPLEKRGRAVRNIMASLQIAARALAEDIPVPAEAVSLMARPHVPVWLYLFIGHAGWKCEAKKFGSLGKLHDKPYLSPGTAGPPHAPRL
jgi:hypothetical protein